MPRNDVHVTPSGDGGWKISGEDRVFTTQREAEQAGRQLAKERHAEFMLHGEDGRIRERDSYGNDPRDIPG